MSPINRTKPETISLKFPEGTKVRIQTLAALPDLPSTMTEILLIGLDALEAGWRPNLGGYPDTVTDILNRLAALETLGWEQEQRISALEAAPAPSRRRLLS
ncbi:MAG: hypothetical protein KJ558_09350 [Gammaproteobacteria bacterium]|nr:hypothetical protein [Gammaproteobacteria bacterium]MBU1655011.1 hypothetical protein [Gammaproteobacteria bacterium]MBU1960032.1 hypothetical protein [Gammaproteobacteria bacterium]